MDMDGKNKFRILDQQEYGMEEGMVYQDEDGNIIPYDMNDMMDDMKDRHDRWICWILQMDTIDWFDRLLIDWLVIAYMTVSGEDMIDRIETMDMIYRHSR